MADKKRRAPLPPSNPVHGTQNGGNQIPVREINNPAYVEVDGSQQGKKMTVPLPDYDTLFPQKRHGVQGQTRWDHIIAEVNQRHRDVPPDFLGQEMSVDGPEEHGPSIRSSLPQENPALWHYQTHLTPQETKPVSSKKVAPPAPPKAATSPYPRPVADPGQRQGQNVAHQSPIEPNPSAVPGPVNANSSRESLSVRSRDEARKALQPPTAPRPPSQMDWANTTPDDQRKAQVTVNKEAPIAKPRQKVSGNEPVQQGDSAVTSVVSLNSNIQALSSSNMSSMDKKGRWTQETSAEFDPFPSTDLLPKDPWTQVKQNQEVDDLFTGSVHKEQKFEDRGMTADDLNNIFSGEKPADPFAIIDGGDSNKEGVYRKNDEDSKKVSPAFERWRQREATTHSDNKTFKSQQIPENKEETITTANQSLSTRNVKNESVKQKLQADAKTLSHLNGREDPFEAEPFTITSAWNPSEPLQVVMEEPEAQEESLSGGKMPLRAWVSPSEVQPIGAQNSNGDGLAFTPRR